MVQLAIDYHGSGVFKAREYEPVAPVTGEVRIAVAYTGICGTDLTIAHGGMDGRITEPWPIGHEMSGTVAELGPGVEGWEVGDKVTVMPLDWDGTCPACLAGLNHICQNLDFVGIDSPGALQGGWNVKADWLVRLPPEIDLRSAALVEPVAVAHHDIGRAAVQPGQKVVVIGGGPIGLLIAIIARERGADVLLSEVTAFRLELARELGFAAVDPTRGDLLDVVDTWTASAGADIAFEVSGTAPGVKAMTDVLRRRGTGVIVGIQPKAPPVDVFAIFWKELSVIGARVYERSDFEAAVRLVADGKIPSEALISDVMPLGKVAAAIQRLERGENVVKLLIDCQDQSSAQEAMEQ